MVIGKYMNDLVTDVKSLEIETLKNLENSKAHNTLRAYQADFKDFSVFCIKNGLSSMPTKPKILSIYLTHLSKTSKFSTKNFFQKKSKTTEFISVDIYHKSFFPKHFFK